MRVAHGEATESITVAGLLKALHERRARLGRLVHIALRCLEIGLHNPTELEAERITLTSAGEVVLDQDAEAVDEQSVARSVVSLLGRLLVAAGSGIPPMMLSLVERGRQQQDDSVLDLLRDELEASLVPLNRSASSEFWHGWFATRFAASFHPRLRIRHHKTPMRWIKGWMHYSRGVRCQIFSPHSALQTTWT